MLTPNAARRSSHHQGSAVVLAAVALLTALLLGCGDEAESIELGTVDPALVGRWRGTAQFPLGFEPIDGTLNADATMRFEGNFPKPSGSVSCPMEGRWGVMDGVFRARGNDECDGTPVSMQAPADDQRMTGQLNARSGVTGQFDMEKQ